MDELVHDNYRLAFGNKFRRLTRESFQDWFVEIMEAAYPGDFSGTRQGTTKGGGDLGCDGFRVTTGAVYAVYAPRKCTPKQLHSKIESDVNTALKNFGSVMREWVFVHKRLAEESFDHSRPSVAFPTSYGSGATRCRLESFSEMIC